MYGPEPRPSYLDQFQSPVGAPAPTHPHLPLNGPPAGAPIGPPAGVPTGRSRAARGGRQARGWARTPTTRLYVLVAAALAGVLVMVVVASLVAGGGGGTGAEAAPDARQDLQGFVNGAPDQQRQAGAAPADDTVDQAERPAPAETAQVRLVGPSRATAGRPLKVVAAFRDLPEGARLRAWVQALRPDGRVGATKAAGSCRLDTPGADGTLTGTCPALPVGSYRLAVVVERAPQRPGDFPPFDVGRLTVAAAAVEGTSGAVRPGGSTSGTVPAPDDVRGVEQRMVELTNQARREAGVRPLTVGTRLADTARDWSCDMASAESLRHDPNFADSGAQGENVAFRSDPGTDVALLLHNQFMNSPGHRDNLLNPNWSELGIGFCARNGYWVTERFAP